MLYCKVHHKFSTRRILFSLMLTFTLSASPNVSVAQFADQSLGWTLEQEKAVAGYLIRRLQRQGVVINDIWIEYWMNERAEHLRAASTAQMNQSSTLLIDQRSFNAFALPGNVMGYHLGLWKTAETEAEFVSVVAHEMAHLNLRHFARLADSNRQQAWLAISGAILGIALASTNSDLAGATFFGSQMGAVQQRMAFSRAMETEADRFASRLLAETGYDPGAGAALFLRLQAQTSFQPGLSDYWQTHPLTSSRIASMAQLEDLKTDTAIPPNHYFEVLRWYLNREHMRGDDFASLPDVYRALDHASQADTLFPDNLLLQAEPNLLMGWIYHQQDQSTPARHMERLQLLVRLFPDFDPGRFYLALAQWEQKPTENYCEQALSDLRPIARPYLQVLELRVHLTERCQTERETEALAEYLWHQGEEGRAMSLTRRAIENPASTSQLARLRQQLRFYEKQLDILPR